jgi:putative ABC transport system ATP-binding protein
MGLHLRDLKKTYIGPDGSQVPVIDIVELYIPDAQQTAMIGTSGSGKTTLLHMIAGILPPDSGSVVYGYDPASKEGAAGQVNLAQLSEAQRDTFRGRNIGYIFQTHHLLPGFTALENVLLGMTFTGRAHDPNWARHLLEQVGLSNRLDYKPAKLSVGQQQRVAVARALANRPRLVLADEPTGALDAVNAQQVLELIRRLCAEVSASLLLVSHDLNIARQLPVVLTLTEINKAASVPISSMSNPSVN